MTPVHADDWRNNLQADSRSRIMNRIDYHLRRHLPVAGGEDALQEVRLTATRLESKIYDAAISQSDYLRRISLKILTLESRTRGSSMSGFVFNKPPYDEY